MVIDANMYWFPESFFQDDKKMKTFLNGIPKDGDLYGYVTQINSSERKQVVLEKPKGFQNLNYCQGDYVLEQQLEDMKLAGIDKAVLKLPGCAEWLDINMCRLFNDGMAEQTKRSNGKLEALAVVPPSGNSECFNEIDRCINELGMKGVQLCTHYGEKYLDDPSFADFFKGLNERKVTVYIHHNPVPVEYNCIYEFNNLRRSFGRCVDQTTAIGREIFSCFFDKYPDLKFVHSMLGGAFFAYKEMLMPREMKKEDAVNRFKSESVDMKKYLNNNIFFEMSHAQPWGKSLMKEAIEILGADHILFGTSYPVRKEWLLNGADFMRDLNLTQEELELILYKNAQKLYNI